LADLTLTECFANDPRIPSDALERWQVYEANEPKYVPVIAWCELEKRRPAYRSTCSDVAALQSPSDDLFDRVRKTAHVCVGRTILDDVQPDLVHESSRVGHWALGMAWVTGLSRRVTCQGRTGELVVVFALSEGGSKRPQPH
jgi:hypothetical protein